MLVTLSGIVTLASPLQSENAHSPMPLTLSAIDKKTAAEINAVCGVSPKQLTPTIGGDEIRHTYNHHGKGRERNTKQSPITASDIARIPEIIAQHDSILQGSFNATENAPSAKFVKTYPDGTTYTVFAIADTLKYKTIWKKK